jgi:plastocyanin
VNTAKQVNIMIGLLFVGLVGTFLYYMFDSGYSLAGMDFGNRQAAANERQEKTNVERGAALFVRYCRACHGLTGQGALERPNLPGAALNQDTNHPPTLPQSQLASRQQRLTATITCGRVGTQMPPQLTDWGGALNFFQIQQLVTLITSAFAPEGWDDVVEIGNSEASHGGDRLDPRAFLTEAIGPNDTELHLTNVGTLAEDTIIRLGLEEPGEPYEIMLITDVDREANTLTVERGPDVTLNDIALGSDAIEHEDGAEVFSFLMGLPSGIITGAGKDVTPPCGQAAPQATTAPGAAVTLVSGGTIELADNVVIVDGQNNPQINVTAGQEITATVSNTGTAIHNLRIAGSDGDYNTDDDDVSDPDLISGGGEGTITFNLDAGTYPYQCDFHPTTMLGEIVAQ